MLDTIFNTVMFLIVVGVVALVATVFAALIADTMKYQTKANAFLALFGIFGAIFAVIAPAIFSSVIPVNNWGTALVVFSWLVAAPGLLLLSVWAYERK